MWKKVVKSLFNRFGFQIIKMNHHKEPNLIEKNPYHLPITIIKEKEIQSNSLLKYSKNKYSQQGHDGILEVIFEKLKISNGFFVEFGAWDGIHLSNCRQLFENGWEGAFIEASKGRYSKLVVNYKNCSGVICIN